MTSGVRVHVLYIVDFNFFGESCTSPCLAFRRKTNHATVEKNFNKSRSNDFLYLLKMSKKCDRPTCTSLMPERTSRRAKRAQLFWEICLHPAAGRVAMHSGREKTTTTRRRRTRSVSTVRSVNAHGRIRIESYTVHAAAGLCR